MAKTGCVDLCFFVQGRHFCPVRLWIPQGSTRVHRLKRMKREEHLQVMDVTKFGVARCPSIKNESDSDKQVLNKMKITTAKVCQTTSPG